LRQVGIRPDHVTLLHLPPAEQVAAMANKEIDAAMAWEPWMQRMVHEANARIIAIEGYFGIYTNVASYSARRDWLRDHRETAVRFLRALAMAYGVLHKDPTVGVRALMQEEDRGRRSVVSARSPSACSPSWSIRCGPWAGGYSTSFPMPCSSEFPGSTVQPVAGGHGHRRLRAG
jgi:ABC-type nitrate/sulfonate/bicarbonate transport system substrate-binding protein